LRFLLEDRALAIHRVVISESVRFPELGRAFYDNGPGVFRRVFGNWLAEQTAAGRLAVAEPDLAADQFIGLLRGGLYLRATLGLATPSDAEIDAAVGSAVAAFVRAYVPASCSADAAPMQTGGAARAAP
jgi:TetR/AcrR family transcriptional repressor of mexJK operon